MQHLPSVSLMLRLYFRQVHHTNIPTTASAATDPNTAPTTIPMARTMRDKLQIIFSQGSYRKESASVLLLWSGNVWSSARIRFFFFSQFCVSQLIT